MHQGRFWKRRLGVAFLAGVTALGAASIVGEGVAGALLPPVAPTVTTTVSSAPTVLSTSGATPQAAGSLTLDLGSAPNVNDTITLVLSPSVTWTAVTSSSADWHVTGLGSDTLTLTDTGAVGPQTILLSPITLTSTTATAGALTVAGLYTVTSDGSTSAFTTPAIATVAPSGLAGATVAAPVAVSVIAGGAAATASPYIVTIPAGQQVQTGDAISLTFDPPGGCTATSYLTVSKGVGFGVTTTNGSAFATAGVTETTSPGCAATNTIRIPASAAATSLGGTITISGIALQAPTTTVQGADVVSGYFVDGNPLDGVAGTITMRYDANVVGISVSTVGQPPTLASGSLAQSVPSVVVQEPDAGAITAGYVCLSLTNGNTWANTATNLPTVTVSPGSGAAVGTPVATASYVAFPVTTASTAAAAYTIGGLTVSTSATATGTAGLTVTYGNTATCNSLAATAVPNTAQPFSVTSSRQATYGQNADGTTAMEFETAFKGCTESNGNVVLATDAEPYDALAASYLEGQLGTGILLTSPTSLSTETIDALRVMGVRNVYVVGGPLAVSPADLAQLAALPAYTCGGGSLTGPKLDVVQAATTGVNADATAQLIDSYVTAGSGILSVNGAYSAATATTGGGLYNDTAGNSSAVGSVVAGKTAIVVSDTDFRDAMAAAGIAYQDKLPVILTTPTALGTIASSELKSLGITQVIALGGQLALSDAVVTSIQAMGIPVLRIAGQDYTDTAAQLARFEGATTAYGLGWKASTVLVAQGQGFSDALGAAALSGTSSEPVLLTLGPSLGIGQYTLTILHTAGTTGLGSGVTGSIQVLGGPLAVTAAQIAQMQQAL